MHTISYIIPRKYGCEKKKDSGTGLEITLVKMSEQNNMNEGPILDKSLIFRQLTGCAILDIDLQLTQIASA
ncbi:hypothetical protein [Lentibacillus persicus]|uniref:hypothetical protein n=1 Tax=Lentibacillus persicus TaxID=640948 RepID=UPI001C435111|nr:hypothetical protein [Lentibacillus persicus]